MSEEKRIEWEDYRANYIDNMVPDPDDEFDDAMDDDEDSDEMSAPPGIDKIMGLVAFPFGGSMGGQLVSTPWGPFNNANKLAPHNFYDIKLGHFKGFSTFTNPNFANIMDSIEGVAVWKSLDPYCIAVGKARLYSWREVAENIKTALFGTNNQQNSPDDKILAIRDKIIADNNQNHISNYVAAIFPNGEVIQITPDQDDYYDKLKQINDIKEKISLIVIENGVVKC